jgi:long-chain fatty acid transport protein
MTRGIIALSMGALLAAASTQAMAGGFSRGTADTDILFEQGNFNMRAGVTIVAPRRSYDTIRFPNNAAVPAPARGQFVNSTDGTYSDTYAIPSAAVKYQLADSLGCAGTQTISFGSGATYGPQAIQIGALADGTGTVSEGFTSNEFGLTCGYNFQFANGHKLWFLGGMFAEDFNYEQTVQFLGPIISQGLIGAGVPQAQALALGNVLNGTRSTLAFDGDYEFGYRGGIAYEIPEIALRAQLLYRSEVTHRPSGTFATAADGLFGGGAAPTVGIGTLPQSVEMRVQTGIAPGTLAFGSVKWTDWSVLDTLDYTILSGPLPGPRQLEYFWRDGWTFTGGVGRQFNDTLSGLVSFTYDRGVSTTEDAFFDTYTLALGGAVRDQWGGQLRAGVAVSYLEGGSVSASVNPSAGPGNSFAYTVDNDFAYGASLSYSIKW